MNPTIKDVARLAGVSITTVSFVLNKKNRVGAKTAKKVIEAIKELDYSPNKTAQILKRGNTKEICLIISGPNYEYFSNPYIFELIKGINDNLVESNYHLTLKTTTSKEEENFIKNEIKSNIYSGLILWGTRVNDETFNSFFKLKIPVVSIGRKAKKGFSIIVDDYKGAYLMTDFLIKKGHKKIAYIGKLNGLALSDLRLNGYKDALKKNKLSINENIIIEANFYLNTGYDATCKLIQNHSGEFSAIFAASDLMAIGCLKSLIEYNFKIPEDIAVAGFDNIQNTDLLLVPLTTVKTPIYEMGQIAVIKLLEIIENKIQKIGENILDISILERSSV